ncbi:MAG: hypothetical protein ABJF50_24585 [Paracoccaceae bacterium]|uniref:hypothetical protein n=1 Tax=Hyphomonas sp. TaxID=87 RepID=UPI00326F8A12
METPYPGEFFFLNIGCRKNTLQPEIYGDAQKFLVRKDTGQQVWHINKFYPDSEVVLSSAALEGADLWVEETVHRRVFMSDALARAIVEIGMADIFKLQECRIVGEAQ